MKTNVSVPYTLISKYMAYALSHLLRVSLRKGLTKKLKHIENGIGVVSDEF